MIENIRRVRMSGPAALRIELYSPETDKNGDYGIGDQFRLGMATSAKHGLTVGVYEVTSAVNKQAIELLGVTELGQALTGRGKLKAEITATLAAGLFAGNWGSANEAVSIAAEYAEQIIKDNES